MKNGTEVPAPFVVPVELLRKRAYREICNEEEDDTPRKVSSSLYQPFECRILQLFADDALDEACDYAFVFAPHRLRRGGEGADVVLAGVDLRDALFETQQGIDRHDGRADGVFDGEDAVALDLAELSYEGEVHAAFGDDLRTVRFEAGHELAGDVGHHDRDDGAFVEVLLHPFRIDAQVVEQLLQQLAARTFAHLFVDEIAFFVGEEGVGPGDGPVGGLVLELRLAVDGDAHEPAGVADRDDAAGGGAVGQELPFGERFEQLAELRPSGGDGEGFPFAFVDVTAEDFGLAEGGVFPGDFLPEAPAGPFAAVEHGGGLHVAHRGVLGHRAVGEKDEIVGRRGDLFGLSVALQSDGCDALPAVDGLDIEVGHDGIENELHAPGFEVSLQRQDQRVVLVVFGEDQPAHRAHAGHEVDEAVHVAFHLDDAVPCLEGEHAPPVEPHVGLEIGGVEILFDGHTAEVLFFAQQEFRQLFAVFLLQPQRGRAQLLAAVVDDADLGEVGVDVVEFLELVEYAAALFLDRGDLPVEVPEAFVVRFHLPSAPGDEARFGRPRAVHRPAADAVLLEDGDLLAFHVPVAHQVLRRRERRDPGTDEKGPLLLDPFRFSGFDSLIVVHDTPPFFYTITIA